jgi:hypothetical protein
MPGCGAIRSVPGLLLRAPGHDVILSTPEPDAECALLFHYTRFALRVP